jgi:hypothetical protein
MESTRERAHRAWRNAERIKRLSDNLVKIGPWGLGLDGVLAWVPVAGTLYSLGSGGLLLYEGLQAQAAPWAMDTLFRGQLMAANALQKDIVKRWGPADPAPVETAWRPVARSAP